MNHIAAATESNITSRGGKFVLFASNTPTNITINTNTA